MSGKVQMLCSRHPDIMTRVVPDLRPVKTLKGVGSVFHICGCDSNSKPCDSACRLCPSAAVSCSHAELIGTPEPRECVWKKHDRPRSMSCRSLLPCHEASTGHRPRPVMLLPYALSRLWCNNQLCMTTAGFCLSFLPCHEA